MITKIRAKQLHEDVRGLVGEYGKAFFLSKESAIESQSFWSGVTGSGYMTRRKIQIPSGVDSLSVDISSQNFSFKPFVNYSLISPSGDASFYITQASVSSLTGINISFSNTVLSSGYEVDLLYGSSSNVFFINQLSENPILSDIENPSAKYEIAISGGNILAIPL